MTTWKATILLIEGDLVQRDLIELALQRNGYEMLWAQESENTIHLLQERHPDLILVDVLLPQENGLDLIQRARDKGLLDLTPVIVFSALGYREIVQQAIRVGACDFLIKPLDMDALIVRIQAALQGVHRLSDKLWQA